MDGDEGTAARTSRDALREEVPIDRERRARGHPHRVRDAHDERVHPPHLLLEQAGGLIEGVAAQAVGAHELGEVVGLVDRGADGGPHLVQIHGDAAADELPRGLAAREAPSDDANATGVHAARL